MYKVDVLDAINPRAIDSDGYAVDEPDISRVDWNDKASVDAYYDAVEAWEALPIIAERDEYEPERYGLYYRISDDQGTALTYDDWLRKGRPRTNEFFGYDGPTRDTQRDVLIFRKGKDGTLFISNGLTHSMTVANRLASCACGARLHYAQVATGRIATDRELAEEFTARIYAHAATHVRIKTN